MGGGDSGTRLHSFSLLITFSISQPKSQSSSSISHNPAPILTLTLIPTQSLILIPAYFHPSFSLSPASSKPLATIHILISAYSNSKPIYIQTYVIHSYSYLSTSIYHSPINISFPISNPILPYSTHSFNLPVTCQHPTISSIQYTVAINIHHVLFAINQNKSIYLLSYLRTN